MGKYFAEVWKAHMIAEHVRNDRCYQMTWKTHNTQQLQTSVCITGWPQSRRKNSLSFPGFSRATNLLFHSLSQQKENVIMTFIKGHSTSTPAIQQITTTL